MEHDRYDVVMQESTPSYGKLTIEPLERGYGVTLGNSLRRVLLSSISGAAIIAVRIEGVLHEFSTVPGVKEDVIELLVNLKHIAVRCSSNTVKTLRLEAVGPKRVTAADIEPDADIEFPNPDAYICTLEDGARIAMDIYVSTGTGYAPIDRPRAAWLPADALQTDALFSPVERVKYEIADKRQGQRTDYDSLNLEIWTNSTVSAEDAIVQAGRILKSYYVSIIEAIAGPGSSDVEDLSSDNTPKQKAYQIGDNAWLGRSIRDLELSVRSENCLLRGGVHLISDLVEKTKEDLMKTRNLGRISLKEIEERLEKLDLHLAGNTETEEEK
ncbi:MAG: DNA-directed RNA polymerase subunit alpha [Synergistaceae bacterium]|nr:DNA-directed RNA polymerase subunit alpha [Synergistaceae bacterium]